MEMNTRLQVEHPVTEAITGLDLVAWQFRVAAGEKLPLKQDQVRLDGHAVEARLYAEDPERGFLPSTGRLVALSFPRGASLRIDSGVEAGDAVTPFYDPMIAKVIAHGGSRDAALDALASALEGTVVAGPRSNAGFLAALARADGFRQCDFDTGFIDRNLRALGAVPLGLDRAAAAAGARALVAREQARLVRNGNSPWDVNDAFQFSGMRRLALPIVADGEAVVAEIEYEPLGAAVSVDGAVPADDAAVIAQPDAVYVLRGGRQTKVTLRDLALDQAGDTGAGGLVRAPMHGKVLAVLVEKGAQVARGQRVAIIEAMKMEHTLTAPVDGTVSEIAVAPDAQVAEGAKVLVVEPAVPQP
jgi:3-methylcrotonyl-CoA carboxylase alpha subunit